MSILINKNRKKYYFTYEIWEIITTFLGKDYWGNRRNLTYVLEALDLLYSDYNKNSLFKLYKAPEIPNYFNKIKYNPYIISIRPPILNSTGKYLRKLHKYLYSKVFFRYEMKISNR